MFALYHVMVHLHVGGDYECPSVLCPVGRCSSIRCSTAPAPIRRGALVKLVSVGLFGVVMSAPAATRNCNVEIAKAQRSFLCNLSRRFIVRAMTKGRAQVKAHWQKHGAEVSAVVMKGRGVGVLSDARAVLLGRIFISARRALPHDSGGRVKVCAFCQLCLEFARSSSFTSFRARLEYGGAPALPPTPFANSPWASWHRLVAPDSRNRSRCVGAYRVRIEGFAIFYAAAAQRSLYVTLALPKKRGTKSVPNSGTFFVIIISGLGPPVYQLPRILHDEYSRNS